MKTHLAVVVVFLCAGIASAQSSANQAEEIRALENARNEAILHGDAATLDRMTSDDYTFITLRGELRTKREKGSENQKDYSGSYRFTRVYIRTNGRWQTVALQATRIEPS